MWHSAGCSPKLTAAGSPDRDATLGQALDRYLEVADLEVSTREAHEGYIRRTIGPVLGDVKVRKLGADSLDALYTALKKCSRLCGRFPKLSTTPKVSTLATSGAGRSGTFIDHRATSSHRGGHIALRPSVLWTPARRPGRPGPVAVAQPGIPRVLDLDVGQRRCPSQQGAGSVMINKTFVSSVCTLNGRTGLKRGASRARRWPARRGTGRGTGGREIPVLSALQAWSGVLFVQVAVVQWGACRS